MYGISVRPKKLRGKHPRKLETDIIRALEQSVPLALDIVRNELMAEVPKGMKDMRERGQMHLEDYLRIPSLCVRRPSKLSGYVFFNKNLVPHVKYILGKVGQGMATHGGYRIPKTGYKYYLHWVDEEGEKFRTWTWRIHGIPRNDFRTRAYVNARAKIFRVFQGALVAKLI